VCIERERKDRREGSRTQGTLGFQRTVELNGGTQLDS
jgi:hypothetical protein